MNDKFDQLAKSVAESVTRRQALKRFAGGLAGMALACFCFEARAECLPSGSPCDVNNRVNGNRSCNKCCSGVPTCKTDKAGNTKCVCLCRAGKPA
jgi:hypothetical protein